MYLLDVDKALVARCMPLNSCGRRRHLGPVSADSQFPQTKGSISKQAVLEQILLGGYLQKYERC